MRIVSSFSGSHFDGYLMSSVVPLFFLLKINRRISVLSFFFGFFRCPRLPFCFFGIWMIMDVYFANIQVSRRALWDMFPCQCLWFDRSHLVILCLLFHAAVNGQFLRGLGGKKLSWKDQKPFKASWSNKEENMKISRFESQISRLYL